MPDGDAMLLIWLNLLVLAGLVNDGGLVYLTRGIPYTEEMLAEEMRRSLPVIRSAISVFRTLNMVEDTPDGLLISNWEKHQSVDGMERAREQAKIRMRNYRDRKRLETGQKDDGCVTVTQHVTPCYSDVTHQNKNKKENKKEEKEEDIYNTPPRKYDMEKGFSKQEQAGAGVNDILRGGNGHGGDTARACSAGKAESGGTGGGNRERAEAGENRLRGGNGTEKPLNWRDLSKDRLH